MNQQFNGSPARFRKLALLVGLGTHAYLYAGMITVEYVWRSQDWIFDWKIVAAVSASAMLLSYISYRSMMRLDGRLGKGSRWILETRQITLPQQRE